MTTTTDHSRAVLAGEHSHGAGQKPPASRAARTRSFDVADFPMPTGREEEWRFSRMKDLAPGLEDTPTQDDGDTLAANYEVDLAGTPDLPGLAPGQWPRGSALIPGDRSAVVASANTPEALHVRIPAGTTVAEPVRVDVTGTAGRRSNAHHVIEAQDDSNAVVVFEHSGSGVHAGNVEIIVGDRAHLTVISLQLWDDDAVHVGQHEAAVGADAKYRHINVTLGGKAVRLTDNAHFTGPHGDVELLGVYFVDAGQHLEHQTYINHNAPDCISRVTYKGALHGQDAHSVWIGDVLIGAEAEGTDTYELNRNLVLSEGARADSVPNLEIETGEIEGAGHASATGRFDDEQLFYLMSRGIPEDLARKLVVRGFFLELIQQIGVQEIEERLMELIELELRGENR
ncbi:MAG TPA: Fe-S cluster assembly protein SufD [Actinomycetaceae bacterium]|nr:Fe-S cluster assembly protein SufD [Actinomycetaceae bacterium]